MARWQSRANSKTWGWPFLKRESKPLAATLEHQDAVTSLPPGGTETELSVYLKRQRCHTPCKLHASWKNHYSLYSLCSYSVSNSSGFNWLNSKLLISSNLGSQLLPLGDCITTEKTPEARWQKGAINSHRCETTAWKRKQDRAQESICEKMLG